MRLDRLHRAYPSLHPSGVVHWVPVLSNIKTANGCESNRQLQLWTVFAGTVVNNYQFNGIQGWAGQLCHIRCRASSECLKKSFETHPSVAVSQWSISSFIHETYTTWFPLIYYHKFPCLSRPIIINTRCIIIMLQKMVFHTVHYCIKQYALFTASTSLCIVVPFLRQFFYSVNYAYSRHDNFDLTIDRLCFSSIADTALHTSFFS